MKRYSDVSIQFEQFLGSNKNLLQEEEQKKNMAKETIILVLILEMCTMKLLLFSPH